MLQFNEQSLKDTIHQMPRGPRVAFAASCAQRLQAVLHSFVSDTASVAQAKVFDQALDYVWLHTLAPHEPDTTRQLYAEVLALIPDEDDIEWTPTIPYVDDALSAVAYCLRCLETGEPQEAVWAARRVYEAIDHFVISRDDLVPSQPSAEAGILADPLIQAELERQARDIAELSALPALSEELVNRLRRRSTFEQAIPLNH
jgi:hypothetical protein